MKLNSILQSVAACLMLAVLSETSRADAPVGPKNATVLIIRHGEKKDPEDKKDIGLNDAGNARAQAYVNYFSQTTVDGATIKPDFLFAAAQSKHSDRPRLTIAPLAAKLNENINTSFDEANVVGIAKEVSSGRDDGKTILICWHHGKIPDLLAAFGADPQIVEVDGKWPRGEFGWLVILRFDSDGKLTSSKVINEKLMPDDEPDPPTVK